VTKVSRALFSAPVYLLWGGGDARALREVVDTLFGSIGFNPGKRWTHGFGKAFVATLMVPVIQFAFAYRDATHCSRVSLSRWGQTPASLPVTMANRRRAPFGA